MAYTLKHSRLVWLAIGLALGMMIGGWWPATPLHAVATDRYDTFAIATGPVDDQVEAIFFLDFLTGDLRAAVMNQYGKFTAFYHYNILADLAVEQGKAPRYLMVTGINDIQRGAARARPSRAIVYVAEINSGEVAAYAIPWVRQSWVGNQLVKAPMIPMDKTKFRTAAVRPQ